MNYLLEFQQLYRCAHVPVTWRELCVGPLFIRVIPYHGNRWLGSSSVTYTSAAPDLTFYAVAHPELAPLFLFGRRTAGGCVRAMHRLQATGEYVSRPVVTGTFHRIYQRLTDP